RGSATPHRQRDFGTGPQPVYLFTAVDAAKFNPKGSCHSHSYGSSKTLTGAESMTIAHPHVLQFGAESIDVLDPRLDSEPLGDSYWKVLHAFLTDTYETCRYYRDRFDRASLAPNKLRSWDDFQAIPPLAPRHVGGLLSPDNLHPASEFDLLPDLYRATLIE